MLTGSTWEVDFWRVGSRFFYFFSGYSKRAPPQDVVSLKVVQSMVDPSYTLDTKFDLTCDTATFTKYNHERARAHETRCVSYGQRKSVVDFLLCLGK